MVRNQRYLPDPKSSQLVGNITASAYTTSLALRKGRAQERICKVISSPYFAEVKARFQISSEVHLYYVVSGTQIGGAIFSVNQIIWFFLFGTDSSLSQLLYLSVE